MSIRYSLILLTLLFTSAQAQRHVMLISIDGFRPAMYQDPGWNAPNLRAMMKTGAYADHMLSVFPAYTYPSHVAMVTGALPARSGIPYNVKDAQGNWYWRMSDIKVPTLWQALKHKGLTTAAIQWPVSVDDTANRIITYNIPEIWNRAHPSDRIGETRKYATVGLIEEIEQNATGRLDSVNMNEEHFSLDENSARIAAYIFKKYKPALLAVHFALVDGMQHEYGTNHDSVRLALANADHGIGVILEAIKLSGAKDSTTVIVVGDHGFSDMNTVLRVNTIIKGLDASFKTAGGSAFLYGNKTALGEVRKRLGSLAGDIRKLFRVVERKELDRMGADSAALIALAAVPGTIFSASATGATTGKIKGGGHHGYDPNLREMYTGFISAGAGVNRGVKIEEIRVTDIAGLIAKLLHIEFKTPDGQVVQGVCKE